MANENHIKQFKSFILSLTQWDLSFIEFLLWSILKNAYENFCIVLIIITLFVIVESLFEYMENISNTQLKIKRLRFMWMIVKIDFNTFKSIYESGWCSCTTFALMIANTSPVRNIAHDTISVISIRIDQQKSLFTIL